MRMGKEVDGRKDKYICGWIGGNVVPEDEWVEKWKKWIARKTEELIPEQENVNILTKSL